MTAEEKAAKRAEIKLKYQEFMKCYPLDTKSLADEIWADITGYEGEYQISTYGRIKSFKNGRGREMILVPLYNDNGYLQISLCHEGKHQIFSIHVLVARAFVPNPDKKPQVNHQDGNKWNCHFENLKWATRSENMKHAYAMCLATPRRGGDNYKASLTNEEARYCREVCIPGDKEFGIKALAERFGISTSCMGLIIRGKTYKDA